jgi:deoxyribose-phosphate aldolase
MLLCQMLLNKYIDHTILSPITTSDEIEILCGEAKQYQFAAVCIPPPFVKKAKVLVEASDVKVATVIGFPFGYSAVEAKIAESVLAIVDGADELDVVINLIALKNNDWTYLANEINHLMPIIKQHNKVIKIIIESGILTSDEIAKCCEMYGVAGIDYLKTSTGFAEQGATVEAVKMMRENLPATIQVKASGGLRTYTFAKELIEAGAGRLGCSASVAIMQSIAS